MSGNDLVARVDRTRRDPPTRLIKGAKGQRDVPPLLRGSPQAGGSRFETVSA
jgi:hypothetical protein